ncbi:MAG: hypothetical protein KKD11_00570 [Candidatus Omnitrophica bacterium]|nr:hypothetical protein [Candidatus Omnitrophota bacterium]
MRGIKKGYSLVLIFTTIGVFLWVDIGYSLRIPHGCTSKTTIDRLISIRMKALVRKVEKVKQREIELEIDGQKKNFFVVEWEKASQWIYENYPGLTEFERETLLYNDDTLFDNSESLAEEFEIYKAPVMIKLRRAVVEVILRLWCYTTELLRESFLKLVMSDNYNYRSTTIIIPGIA